MDSYILQMENYKIQTTMQFDNYTLQIKITQYK